ncbi:GNAT family N-acetyltransferase [Bradyrhizobium sp. CB1717]|uniref:GNAT family N-acetyltransferase n=1 Tax=Bradyrhizobium sp. CB1717 TaxID=3039154 RepID=UPI0024B07C4E|nr:GNAT family N-acetyltransferase [Bradyrhizobium sp. CB1717]WFU25482.1 GNAT family N-acetyltransferase [Bradyrhizobium sp. CB1717]
MKTTYFLSMHIGEAALRSWVHSLDLTTGPELDPERYLNIYRRVGAPWGWRSRLSWTTDEIATLLTRDDREVCVLHEATSDIGFYEIDLGAEREAEILYFGLIPTAVGRGYGFVLMDDAIHRAYARGVRLLRIKTSTTDHPNALRLYHKVGFRLCYSVTVD